MHHAARALFASIASLLFVGSLGCDASAPTPTDDAGTTPDAASGPEVDASSPPPDDAFSGPPDAFNAGAGETGRMVGMTEAHNRFRRMATTDTPIPDLVWDAELAAVAQAYSEQLAADGCGLMHSSNGYGENLYWQRGLRITSDDVVASWHEEIECYTYGPFMRGDACDSACIRAMNSNGCGHYTQVVWRDTRRLGCGMATCSNGAEIWTCNYDPPGNYLGRVPY
jgi:uncharacterized protein YkwD